MKSTTIKTTEMDSEQMFKVGDRVICEAPESMECNAPARPKYGADLVIDEIVVKHNIPWLVFHSVHKKFMFQAKFFRKPDYGFASKILKKMKKEATL